MSTTYDLFISYRRKDSQFVDTLARSLESEGLTFWLDRNEIEDAAAIQNSIDQGLAQSKALLSWYSHEYPHSRACQWELTAALIAAGAETAPVKRLLVINPEADADHIHPLQVQDLHHFTFNGDYTVLAQTIGEIVRPITGVLGALRRLEKPKWYGLHGLGSTRFMGRERDLWDIHSALTGGNFAIVAGLPGPTAATDLAQVRGSGGIGKSLLAEEYGLRFGAAWPGGIFWLNGYGADDTGKETENQLQARREAAYSSQLGAFALQLGLDTRDRTDQELLADIGRALIAPTLWIVDDLPGCPRQELERWLAPSPLAITLITTRSKRQDGLGIPIDLGLLDPDGARALLTLGHTPQADEEEAIDALLNMLDGHALALDVARAACIRLGFQRFWVRLQHPDTDALDLAAQLAPDLPNGHNPSIAATLLSAIRHLDAFGLDVLRLAACVATAPIPQDLLIASLAEADQIDLATAEERAALGLQQVLIHSLAEETISTATFSVHALVTRTIKRHDPSPDRQNSLKAAALAVINQRMEASTDIRQHARLLPLLPHAQMLAADPKDLTSLSLASWLGRFEAEAGRYGAARIWYESEYRGHILLLGEEHLDTLTSMNNLAGILRNQGDLHSARALDEKVLEVRTRVLGEEHPVTLSSINNLAGTLGNQGDLQGARILQERVLKVRTRVLGEEHPNTLTSMSNLAGTLGDQGDLQGARTLQEKVLEVRTRVLGEEHPDTLTSMGNLAETLRNQGDLQGARILQEKVLEIRTRVLGEEHLYTLTSMNNLAETLRIQGDLKGARALQEKVLEGRNRVLGEEHPNTLTSMGNLAETLRIQGDLQGARTFQEKVLEGRNRVLGEEHPSTLISMNNLALTLWNQGDLHGALALQEKVVEMSTRVLGEEHPDTTINAWNLFSTLYQQGQHKAAQVLLKTHLLWLLTRAPSTLSANQRQIREHLALMVHQQEK